MGRVFDDSDESWAGRSIFESPRHFSLWALALEKSHEGDRYLSGTPSPQISRLSRFPLGRGEQRSRLSSQGACRRF